MLVVGGFAFSVLSVAVHRFLPVPVTFLMVQRLAEGKGYHHEWVPLSRISDNLKVSVIAAEDAKFCTHYGFDMTAIEKAQRSNARGKKVRGGSTISQQTAKNAFLWPQRSYVRKGVEAYYTLLIETLWSKKRIMEVYLNSAEWGPGIYGAEAASQYWFGKSASELTRSEASRLAAILPSPLKWKAANSGKYVKRRSGKISANAGLVKREGIGTCVLD
ncbi:monofunctional biosynthetic peptidoglycan transglycosylase [Asticcacaulis sp. BYS171W]|uniref:Biosynthetic peptidoglycan transglycosylase n=1 Tax=Asticcacaulis aquaticus TaxID=2984212 RepID=A0ABT5HRK3_9CAUL|nr:monofunctional biosynthetic peptidoglycan transglycosylase [Asticcacaulis aquaticus]MDC7682698.1 monofunctional biosynthetic peptidoglycan transglycosylase [Asticcacaulis aquaticus]